MTLRLVVVLTAYTPIERQRWYRRVSDLYRDGTPLCLAVRIADLATQIDRAEERAAIARWRAAGSVEA